MWVKVKDHVVNLKHIWKVVISEGRYMAFHPASSDFRPLVVGVEGKLGMCDVFVTPDEFERAISNFLALGPVVVDLLEEREPLEVAVGGTD